MPPREIKDVSSAKQLPPTAPGSRIVSLLMILEALRQATAETQKAA